jgi:ABC-type phosphate/phosphonate transport system substrate-binding protein
MGTATTALAMDAGCKGRATKPRNAIARTIRTTRNGIPGSENEERSFMTAPPLEDAVSLISI